jgi:hypothetical protein
MLRKEEAPGVVTHAAGAQMKPLALASGDGFVHEYNTLRAVVIVICHRCRGFKPRRGALCASVENGAGEHVPHYLCAGCCAELAGGGPRA